jgi:glycosyltransferase involved in cell wall biosynthesis
MATYNGEEYLSEQLDSILGQLGRDDELVISDDHSTDRTIKIIEECGDSRIRLVYNGAGRGYTRNFENALKNAKGEIIFISDQDDVWRNDKVEVMKKHLNDYDLVVSDATYVDHRLEVTRGSHFKLLNLRGGFFRQALRPRYIGACMAFRRSVLQRALPFPRNGKYCAYDYWLTLIGECCYRVGLVDQELILYRRHLGNASPAGVKSPNSLLKKVLIRVYPLAELVRRIAATALSTSIQESPIP